MHKIWYYEQDGIVCVDNASNAKEFVSHAVQGNELIEAFKEDLEDEFVIGGAHVATLDTDCVPQICIYETPPLLTGANNALPLDAGEVFEVLANLEQ